MMDTKHESKVITVTLNPSLERTVVTHFMALGYHNQTRETTRLDPAGRGVSIARALHSLGIPTHALLLIAHDTTGRAYQMLLTEEQFPISILRRGGQTRSRMIIRDTGHDNETTIGEDATGVTEDDLQQVAGTLKQLINPGDIVIFAGSLPGEVPLDTYAWLTDVAQSESAHVAVNAGGGEALHHALKAQPDMVYLTQLQAEGMVNYPVRTVKGVIDLSRRLCEEGVGTVLMMMNEDRRAVLATKDKAWLAEWPGDPSGTHSGIVEAMIAGYFAARLREKTQEDALKLSAAAADYTVTQLGHEFGTLKDLEDLIPNVQVTPADAISEQYSPGG